MRRDEYPPLFVRVWAFFDLPLIAGLLALGVIYVVRGNTGGDVLGAVFIAVAAWRLSVLVRTVSGR